MDVRETRGMVDAFRRGRISRRAFIQRALAMGISAPALVSILAACTAPAPAAAPAATSASGSAPAASGPSGSARFLIAENFWADWEPYQSTAQSQRRLNVHLYDSLVEVVSDDMGDFQPALAESWEQIDEQTWEFRLREGVTFHNGAPFTAADVKASIERASGATDVETVSAGEWVPTTVEVVDDLTVRLNTETSFGPLLSAIASTIIISAADLEAGDEQLRTSPNGTGPFTLVEEETTRKVMAANPDYWRGAPPIESLTWEFIQDPQTRLNALLAGQADAIDRVPPEHFDIIQSSDDLQLQSVTGIEQVNLWCRPGRLELWDTNPDFRAAVHWAINREALVSDLVMGASEVAASPIPSRAQFYQPQTPMYTYDPDQAMAALEAAGVPDGGPEFELWAATGFLPRAREVAESIADSMSQVGLKPQIVLADVAALVDDIFTEEGGTGLMYHLSWSGNGDPHSSFSIYASPFVWADGDPKTDELFQAGATATDPAEREEIYAELQSYLWEKQFHVPLYYSDFTVATNERLQDLMVLPNFKTWFYPASVTA